MAQVLFPDLFDHQYIDILGADILHSLLKGDPSKDPQFLQKRAGFRPLGNTFQQKSFRYNISDVLLSRQL